jgi:hypothetical protein
MTSLLSIKLAVKYAQLREVESMRAITGAHQNRNLADFEKASKDYKDGACFSLLPFSSLTVFSYRALFGPDDPLSHRCSVRHPRLVKSPADRRALFSLEIEYVAGWAGSTYKLSIPSTLLPPIFYLTFRLTFFFLFHRLSQMTFDKVFQCTRPGPGVSSYSTSQKQM